MKRKTISKATSFFLLFLLLLNISVPVLSDEIAGPDTETQEMNADGNSAEQADEQAAETNLEETADAGTSDPQEQPETPPLENGEAAELQEGENEVPPEETVNPQDAETPQEDAETLPEEAVISQENAEASQEAEENTEEAADEESSEAEMEAVALRGAYQEAAERPYLGVAGNFNIFALENWSSINSGSCNGRAAAGGNIETAHYGFGDYYDSLSPLQPNPNRFDIIVGGAEASFGDGSNYNGSTLLDSNCALIEAQHFGHDTHGAGFARMDLASFFADARQTAESKSAEYGSYYANGSVAIEVHGGGKYKLTLSGTDPKCNVFDLNAADLTNTDEFWLTVPDDSTVIINVRGNPVVFPDLEYHFNQVHSNFPPAGIGPVSKNVLWNLPEAATVSVSGQCFALVGSLLAPFADATFSSGRHYGNFIVKNFNNAGGFTGYFIPFDPTHAPFDPRFLSIPVQALWNDNNNQAQIRPASLTASLLADGVPTNLTLELSDATQWSGTFPQVPRTDANGREILYTLQPIQIEGYTSNVSGTAQDGFTIANTCSIMPPFSPTKACVRFEATKNWDDNEKKPGGIRPGKITLRLYCNGQPTHLTLELNEGNGWHGILDDEDNGIPETDPNGIPYEYSLKEEPPIAGYHTQVVLTGTEEHIHWGTRRAEELADGENYLLTFEYTPQSASHRRHYALWDNGGKIDLTESASIERMNPEPYPDYYKIEEREQTDRNYANGILNPAHIWQFNQNLSELRNLATGQWLTLKGWRIDPHNKPHEYLGGSSPDGADNWTVTDNSYPGGKYHQTKKLWLEIRDGKARIVGNVGHQFPNMYLKYDPAGPGMAAMGKGTEFKFRYPIKKIIHRYELTNTYTPQIGEEEYVVIEVKKAWDDQENADGQRPAAITVHLTVNGADTGQTLELSDANGWKGEFGQLPRFDLNGVEIPYGVREEAIGGYENYALEEGAGSTLTYWLMVNAPEELQAGRKYVIAAQDWGMANYPPHNPNVYHFLTDAAEGERVGLKRLEDTNLLFKGPKSNNGGEALSFGGKTYDEYLEPSNPYTQEIDGSQTWLLNVEEGKWTLQNTGSSLFMTLRGHLGWGHEYSYILSSRTGWDSNEGNNYKHQLDIIKVDDTPEKAGLAKIFCVQQWGGWNGLQDDPPQYEYLDCFASPLQTAATDVSDFAGQFKFFTPIRVTQRTFTLSNRATIDISGSKSWEDNNNQSGKRPDSITIRLLKNGAETDRKTVTEAEGWSWSFGPLPRFENGALITYSITEDPVAGYRTEIAGFSVTNTLIELPPGPTETPPTPPTSPTTPTSPPPPYETSPVPPPAPTPGPPPVPTPAPTPPPQNIPLIPKTGESGSGLMIGIAMSTLLAALLLIRRKVR